MATLQELLDLFVEAKYKKRYATAKATGVCILCGKPAVVFRDSSARFEYSVSALCQSCQDECFKGNKASQ